MSLVYTARSLEKIARSSLSARGMEAAIGAGLGAAAGGAGGAATYEPNLPKEWTSPTGEVHSRRLGRSEVLDRRDRAARSALAGAAAGAAAGPASSSLRRLLIRAAEKRQAGQVSDEYLKHLKSRVKDLKQKAEDPRNVSPIDLITGRKSRAERESEIAQSYLKEEQKRIRSLADAADKNRAERLFGGPTWTQREPVPGSKWRRRDTGKPIDPSLTHRGLVRGSYPEPANLKTLKRFYDRELDKRLNPRARRKS